MSTVWFELFGFVICIGSASLLAACESALTCLGRMGKDSPKSKGLSKWGDEPYRYLVTAMAGNTLAIVGAVLTGNAVAYRFFLRIGVRNPLAFAGGTAFLVTAFSIFLGSEVIAKTYAKKKALSFAPKSVLILDVLYYSLLWLPTRLVLGLTGVLFRTAGISSAPEHVIRTEEELKSLLENGTKNEPLKEEETEMIHSIFELRDTVAREVMVPRTAMNCVPADATLQEVMRCVTDFGHSRVPVYQDKLDNIVGILYAKDLLRYWRIHEEREQSGNAQPVEGYDLEKFMRPAHFVPENKPLSDLLKDFRAKRAHLAVVVDEYGGTAGLVTIEDVLEEIVGEIHDEYDLEEQPYTTQEDGSILVDATMSVYEIGEQLDIHLKGEDFDTLGGFIFSVVEDVPQVGQEILHDGVKITVVEADERHVIKARMQRDSLSETSENGMGEKK